ncbi:MAG: BspA family leucine-rich repeat surface protein [Pseudomonadota bacterium]|nr:BspA family leucine-rich repeat surface protein [Pseudomonadota bacterium]
MPPIIPPINPASGCHTELAYNAFISEWRVASGETIVLPLPAGWSYEFAIDWGDNDANTEAYPYYSSKSHPGRVQHTYAAAGTYVVSIYGVVEGWSFQEIPDSAMNLLAVHDLGDLGWQYLRGAFYNAKNLQTLKGGNTSQVSDMSNMFAGATLVQPDLSHWSFASATDLSGMFKDSTLATVVYDLLLQRIVATTKQHNLTLDAGNSRHSPQGALEKQKLLTLGWTIHDQGATALRMRMVGDKLD